MDPIEFFNTKNNMDTEIHKWGDDLVLGLKLNPNPYEAGPSESRQKDTRDKGMGSTSNYQFT